MPTVGRLWPSVDDDGAVDDDCNDVDSTVDEDHHDWQVLAGSHLMGRVDHFLMGEQSGADPERVSLTRINHYDNCNTIKKNRCHLIKQLFRWRWPRSLCGDEPWGCPLLPLQPSSHQVLACKKRFFIRLSTLSATRIKAICGGG